MTELVDEDNDNVNRIEENREGSNIVNNDIDENTNYSSDNEKMFQHGIDNIPSEMSDWYENGDGI